MIEQIIGSTIELIFHVTNSDFIYLIFKIILGAIITTLIGALWRENILKFFSVLVILISKIKFSKKDVEGTWEATFTYKNYETKKNDSYIEKIQIYSVLNMIVGKVFYRIQNNKIDSKITYKSKPVRVIGRLIDNNHISGTWYHPDKEIKTFGSFQLTINHNRSKLVGKWIGFNRDNKSICSNWVWNKKREQNFNNENSWQISKIHIIKQTQKKDIMWNNYYLVYY